MNAPAQRLFRQAVDLRAEQAMEDAREAMAAAAALSPDDAAIALANARIHFETWREATALFERALALAPADPAAVAGMAAALGAEGQVEAAKTLLASALARDPGWIAGHRQLTTLHVTSGRKAGFDESFADACKVEPANPALRLAWFHTLAAARDWPGARAVLAEGIAACGAHRGFDLAAIFVASESDEASRDLRLFDAVATVQDVGLDLCRVRFWLRNGRPDTAVEIAMRHIDGRAARIFWPYLALAWRLTGDRRAAWLDGDPLYVAHRDLPLPLAELSAVLRRLLTMQAPYFEQSVRGGVQTERNLFWHPAPVIQLLRICAIEAVRSWVERLPEPVAGHPLLGVPRHRLEYEGSWSVLLAGGGHHAPHTHSRGWISSAFHVDLPAPSGEKDGHAGELAFGAPPPELGLDLEPLHHVEPRAGRLILFPSTLWHATVPFHAGERLTVAFDIKVPTI